MLTTVSYQEYILYWSTVLKRTYIRQIHVPRANNLKFRKVVKFNYISKIDYFRFWCIVKRCLQFRDTKKPIPLQLHFKLTQWWPVRRNVAKFNYIVVKFNYILFLGKLSMLSTVNYQEWKTNYWLPIYTIIYDLQYIM